MKNTKSTIIGIVIVFLIIVGGLYWRTSKLYVGDGLYYARQEVQGTDGFIDLYLQFDHYNGKEQFSLYGIYYSLGDTEVMPQYFQKFTYTYYGEYQKKLLFGVRLSTLGDNHFIINHADGDCVDVATQQISSFGYDWFYNPFENEVDSTVDYSVIELGDGYLVFDGLRMDKTPKPYECDESFIYSLDHFDD